MPQLNVLELAKQGNVKALAALMNPLYSQRALPLSKLPLRIVANLLESAQVPNQQTLSGVCPATNNTLEGWTDQANETLRANR